MACKSINRENYLKKSDGKNKFYGQKQKNNKKLFWISPYDPRMPHQRTIISRNYHLLAADKQFSNLFPRKNIVAGSRRLPNLMELVSPTVPRRPCPPTTTPTPDNSPSLALDPTSPLPSPLRSQNLPTRTSQPGAPRQSGSSPVASQETRNTQI